MPGRRLLPHDVISQQWAQGSWRCPADIHRQTEVIVSKNDIKKSSDLQPKVGTRDFLRWAIEVADVLSVDVFDTAITRSVESPADVFALIELRLQGDLGRRVKGLALDRELAEEDARRAAHSAGREEVTLDDIYVSLGVRRPELRSHLVRIRAEEIAAEQSVIMGVKLLLEIVRGMQAAGRRVVFVSDMYLSDNTIEEFLQYCGYDTSGGVLVSSTTGCTKASGSQWAVLQRLVGPEARILHIGDNAWADGASPNKRGVASHLFVEARSSRRSGGPLAPAVLPFSRATRAAYLSTQGDRRDKANWTTHSDRAIAEFMRRFGETWGGVVVGSFIRWLETRVQQNELTQLAFCARDGWLLREAWRVAGFGRRAKLHENYLYISRTVLNMSELFCELREGLPLIEAVNKIIDSSQPIKFILSSVRLLENIELISDVTAAFGNLDVIVPRDRLAELREILLHHQTSLLAAMESFYIETAGYLNQEIIKNARVGMVDLGWHGTLQSGMGKIFKIENFNSVLSGFYYGLWPAAQARRPRAGWMEACFGSDFRSANEQSGLQFAVNILELLHSGNHGSTVGYRQEGGRWSVVMQHSPRETAQHQLMIKHFQEGTLYALKEIFSGRGLHGLDINSLTPSAGLAAIERVALSPTRQERLMLGAMEHAPAANHSSFERLVPALSLSEPPLHPYASGWPSATALELIEMRQLSQDSRWREEAQAGVHSLLDRLDIRTQRTLK